MSSSLFDISENASHYLGPSRLRNVMKPGGNKKLASIITLQLDNSVSWCPYIRAER